MDWRSATYNRLEIAVMAVDRALGRLVERCERWFSRRARRQQPARAGKDQAYSA